ncbi:hypothetical protein [Poseidonia sp.]|uniref:hypothetical protein n=1 Tax=Poseidonia sp. TaxID=2666344 RepID=UPI003F69EECD
MAPQSRRVYVAWADKADDFIIPEPWSSFAKRYEVDIERYPNPFRLLTELLQQWPEKTLTAEEDDKIRMKRLVESIAGYPLISVGRRPLDFPSHPMSPIALALSLYLDQIPSPEPKLNDTMGDLGSWYSLRNYVLMCSVDDQKIELAKMTFNIIETIRNFENEHMNTTFYHPSALDDDERRFLSVLHSSGHDRIVFWPQTNKNGINFGPPIKLTGRRNNFLKTYNYHEFKFERIQTWIKKWVANTEDYSKKSQNFITGTSVILESLFARIRSLLLRSETHIGVGGICIDGGGRISYYSENAPDEEQKLIRNFVNNSLLDLNENRVHEHPFMNVISKEIGIYFEQAEKDKLDWFTKLKNQNLQTQELYKELLGDASSWFYPEISFSEPKEDELEETECTHGNSKSTEEKPQSKFPCIICEKEHVEDFQLSSGNCSRVCPPHWLIFNIANSSKLRNLSLPHELGPEGGIRTKEFGRPKDIIAIDANSLGTIFKSNFEWNPQPSWIQINDKNPFKTVEPGIVKEFMTIYDENRESIENYKVSLHEVFDQIRQINNEELDGEFIDPSGRTIFVQNEVRKTLSNLRIAINTRIIRRSFSFNANWSISLRNKILAGKHRLTPWVAAGDDLILINRILLTPQEISDILTEFHKDLQSKLPKCNISFAGGWSKRTGEGQERKQIIECVHEALNNEKIAKHTWKQRMRNSAKEDFRNLVETKVPCEICSKKGNEWLNDARKKLHFYDAKNDQPASLTVNLTAEELEELAQNEPTNYTK